MKTKFLPIALLLWLALLAGPLTARGQAADTSATAAGLAAARQQYGRALGVETVLFDGPEYVDNTRPGTIGHPFFNVPEWQQGTIRYQGGYFDGLLLRYDLATNQVVLAYPGQMSTVALVPEKIDFFTLGKSHFMRVAAPGKDSSAALPAGFYEVLLAGPVSLLAHHAKRIAQSQAMQALTLTYEQTDQLFVHTATQTAEITTLKSLLALLPAHQDDLKRYAHQHNLRFNAEERAASSAQLLRYAATLPH